MGAALLWEIRSSGRTLVPNPWLRRSLLAILLLMAIGGSAAMLFLPLPPKAGAGLSLGLLSGFVASSLTLSVSAALGGAAALLRHPERARLVELAPLPPLAAVALPIGSVAATTLLPLALFFLPFVVVCFRLAPGMAGIMLLCGAATIGWAVLAALAVVIGLVRIKGKEAASRIAGAGAFSLTLLSLWAFGYLLRLSTGRASVLVFLLISLCLLPRWGAAIARAFIATLQGSESPKYAPEPDWGVPGWGRMLSRTAAAWGLLGTLPAAFLLVQARLPLRWGILATVLLSVLATPLGHLFAAEFEWPDRWRLAPESGRLKLSLLLRVGGSAALVALLAVTVLGWGHWSWVAATTVLIIAFPLSYLIGSRLPRQLTQGVFFLGALLTEALK